MPQFIKQSAVKPGEHFLTVSELGSGWAAIDVWINDEEKNLGPFPEPWNTGFGRYATRKEALAELVAWAVTDELPIEQSLEEEIRREGLV